MITFIRGRLKHEKKLSPYKNLFFNKKKVYFVCVCATPVACGGSQARGHIRTVAAGLHHSHSNARSKPDLLPTPQFTAMPDP